MAEFTDFQKLRASLVTDGWVSPDTYCNFYAPISKKPAVYLLMLVDRESFSQALVAYVGMSGSLANRLAKHPVQREIACESHAVFRWFKPTSTQKLRQVESEYIKKFDPPWNIIGRPRGVALHG